MTQYYDPKMPENSTPASTIASLKANLLASSWQILHEDTSASPSIDVIPPVSQAIGNSLGREVIRLRAPATGNAVEMWTYLEVMPAETHSPWTLQLVGSVAVDYTYGFIYILSVMDRTISLSAKTGATLQGALVASYADNATAIASTPAGLIPIELVACNMSAAGGLDDTPCVITHLWGYTASDLGLEVAVASDSAFLCDVVTGKLAGVGALGRMVNLRNYARDRWTNSQGPLLLPKLCIAGITNFNSTPMTATGGSTFAALGRPACISMALRAGAGNVYFQITTNDDRYSACYTHPSLPLPDMTAYMAAGNNEGLHLVRSLTTTTLQTAMDATSDYPVFTLGSTADIPASGVLVIGDECFPYAGKSGATVTGSTRGAYATAKAAHAVGATVYLASWVVKINGCAVHAGTTKPGN